MVHDNISRDEVVENQQSNYSIAHEWMDIVFRVEQSICNGLMAYILLVQEEDRCVD
jgi:hypothetical protein